MGLQNVWHNKFLVRKSQVWEDSLNWRRFKLFNYDYYGMYMFVLFLFSFIYPEI